VAILSNRKKGLILDILRGSLHDGPGIRTTVFFKGCPLRCKWCHNPESWSSEPQLYYNPEKCVNCLECAKVCPSGAQDISGNRHVVKYGLCITSGRCIKACNYDALRIVGYEKDVDGIFEEIIQDKDFYDISGGGVTLSGGEPMMQIDVVVELLKKCKQSNISTCIETCGYTPQKNYKAVLPYVDLFLFDYKSTNRETHRKLTGAPNDLILKNLQHLYEDKANIILRCPLVPGVNDTMEHLKGIAGIALKYPILKGIEILPYHNMGVSKGNYIGVAMELAELKGVDQEKKDEWIRLLKEMGCTNVKIN
jgi:glycyl-radical enzyme activating protein